MNSLSEQLSSYFFVLSEMVGLTRTFHPKENATGSPNS